MLASTLPAQWLLPVLGWRGLFWAIAVLLALAMMLIWVAVPRDTGPRSVVRTPEGYRAIFRHTGFIRLLPLGFINYGGLIAVQSLWAGPWLTDVAGQSAQAAAQGLFLINLSMLATFMTWGFVMPRLALRGWTAQGLIARGVPASLALLAAAVLLGPRAGAPVWAAWCVSSTFVSLAQPAVAQAFPAAQAGRALSAYNLVIFSGVFFVQWSVGVAIDALGTYGMDRVSAYRVAFALFGGCCALAYAWFLLLRDEELREGG
jgi:predicted MFS family arabinose efflux permease